MKKPKPEKTEKNAFYDWTKMKEEIEFIEHYGKIYASLNSQEWRDEEKQIACGEARQNRTEGLESLREDLKADFARRLAIIEKASFLERKNQNDEPQRR